MKLSVVIVNYNVMHFLEQCLVSVFKAGQGIDMEVFVVDNNSVDGSLAMLRRFPGIRLIANRENVGFSKANNQAIREATGEYVLLLNPDTVVEEDTFRQCLEYMDAHPDAGGMGVKMLDGTGRFLPESKRGLPTPSVAFFKIFGFSRLFPRSKLFGRYHLGYLDKDEIHEVDVLSGAFMLLRKKALDQTGLLDEDFFMYGEDIDLSYRITQASYKNIYFPHTRIIHYKGESTKKGSINYVFVFYNAMVIFARKHFSKKNASLFSFFIHIAIWLRASAAIFSRVLSKVILPILDAAVIFGGIYFIKGYWEQHVVFTEGGQYPGEFIYIALPIYIFVWLFSVWVSGGYDKPVKLARIVQGLFWGTAVILIAYALLSENMRFSRALIIIGAGWAMLSMLGTRSLLHLLGIKAFRMDRPENKRFVVVGEQDETQRVSEILRNTQTDAGFIGKVGISEASVNGNELGYMGQLKDIIGIYKIDEVVFCSKNLAPGQIIDLMSYLKSDSVDFKIAPAESLTIIGSNSINTSGDLYMMNLNNINKPSNRRSKFLLDLAISLLLLLFLPIVIFLVKRPHGLIRNIFMVLFASRSWVGYHPAPHTGTHLPSIRRGVLNPSDVIRKELLNDDIIERLNLLYAKDYKVVTDLGIIRKGFRELGRRS
jgi:GT2 family glycosyltransferase